MPHDMNGRELKPGDRVLIPATVKDVQTGDEYCNVTVVTEKPMPPYTEPQTIVLNTKQVYLD